MISIKVPARICFFGDHQDYLGLPVIAGTINRFIVLYARPIATNSFEIQLKDLNSTKTVSLDEPLEAIEPGDYFRSSMVVLKNKGFVFKQGYTIEISGNIPLNAGLSSSSALVVAWIRFLITSQDNGNVTDAEIGQFAYEAEVEFFDQPGGLMDQYTIAQKGLLYIDTQTGSTERLKGNLGNLVVAESGIKKQTLNVLQNAKVFQLRAISDVKKKQADFNLINSILSDFERYLQLVSKEYHDYWYAATHNYDITKKAKSLLMTTHNAQERLGGLMNAHQKILEEHIKNTPPRMVEMMKAAIAAGARGAKTIGSGGGGCMMAMVSESTKDKVIAAFLKLGAKAAYEVELVK